MKTDEVEVQLSGQGQEPEHFPRENLGSNP